MDIVKKLNPFKRFHHQTSSAPSPHHFDVDSGPTAVAVQGHLATTGGISAGGLRIQLHRPHQHQHQQQQPLPSTEPALQRLILPRREGERKRDPKTAATEKELLNLNHKIEKLLANIDENSKFDESFADDEECVVCLAAKATMRTMPCGHRVVCRKCFVKTIQTAVAERCLPLRCVVCRTKILKLKQQQQQPSLTYHVTHQPQQRQHGHKALLFGSSSSSAKASSSKSSSVTAGSHLLHATPSTMKLASTVQHLGHAHQQHQQQIRSKMDTSQSVFGSKRNALVGPTSSPFQTSSATGTAVHHGQPSSSSPAVKSSSGQGPGGLQLLSAAFGLCGRQTPPVTGAVSAAVGGSTAVTVGATVTSAGQSAGRSSRPMHPQLIYPTENALGNASGGTDRWWPGVSRRSVIGWSDEGDSMAGGVSRPTDDRSSRAGSSASPVIVLSSSAGRRRSKHVATGAGLLPPQFQKTTFSVAK